MTDKISIVITTHGEGRDVPGILNSIEMQRQYRTGTSTRGEPYNYEAGPHFTKPPIEVIVSCDGPFDRMDIFAGVHRWVENEKSIAPCCGHNTRDAGIQAATGEWIVLTNSDNFFMHGWYHSVAQCLLPEYGLVYWDIVSNLWTWRAPSARLEWGQIDLSSCCIRADIAKEVGFPFRNYDGDWDYVDACNKLCLQRGLRSVHINEILSVHN